MGTVDGWMKGIGLFVTAVVGFVLLGVLLNYFGVHIPPVVGRLVGLIVLIAIVRLILNQIFD